MQVITGPLRMRGDSEDQPFVVLQRFQPAGQIGRMVGAWLDTDAQRRSEEGRTQLGHQLFGRIAMIPKALCPEIAIEARRVARPVN